MGFNFPTERGTVTQLQARGREAEGRRVALHRPLLLRPNLENEGVLRQAQLHLPVLQLQRRRHPQRDGERLGTEEDPANVLLGMEDVDRTAILTMPGVHVNGGFSSLTDVVVVVGTRLLHTSPLQSQNHYFGMLEVAHFSFERWHN